VTGFKNTAQCGGRGAAGRAGKTLNTSKRNQPNPIPNRYMLRDLKSIFNFYVKQYESHTRATRLSPLASHLFLLQGGARQRGWKILVGIVSLESLGLWVFESLVLSSFAVSGARNVGRHCCGPIMPVVLLDRSVQKRCDRLESSVVEYGALVGSGTAGVAESSACVVDAIQINVANGSPWEEVARTLQAESHRLGQRLCSGVQIIGYYAFVMTAGAEDILKGLERLMGSLDEAITCRMALMLTSNRSVCRLSLGGGAPQPGSLKLQDVQHRFRRFCGRVQVALRFGAGTSGKNSGDSICRDLGVMLDGFQATPTVVTLDKKVLPEDLAKLVTVGDLPQRSNDATEHIVAFFPVSPVLSNVALLDTSVGPSSVATVEGTFSCQAYVHESYTVAAALRCLVEDLKQTIGHRVRQVLSPTVDGAVSLPLRYGLTCTNTVLPHGFSVYGAGDEDHDALIAQAAEWNLTVESVACLESHDSEPGAPWPCMQLLLQCPSGEARKAAPVESQPAPMTSAADGDVDMGGFETVAAGDGACSDDDSSDGDTDDGKSIGCAVGGTGATAPARTETKSAANMSFVLLALGVGVLMLGVLMSTLYA
jgi:hypothetical protein